MIILPLEQFGKACSGGSGENPRFPSVGWATEHNLPLRRVLRFKAIELCSRFTTPPIRMMRITPLGSRMPEHQAYLAPDLVPRLGAIDIGSNSIRIVVAEAQAGGRYRILDEERETTRLGRALASTGRIDQQSIEASLAALRRFKSIAAGLGVEFLERLRDVATFDDPDMLVRQLEADISKCREITGRTA